MFRSARQNESCAKLPCSSSTIVRSGDRLQRIVKKSWMQLELRVVAWLSRVEIHILLHAAAGAKASVLK